ncbi:MAPEG family protein [Parasphingopyxis sp.]|uniref:MAPEG family protein n=1 Tax=Parasphingopyxis sp. TaxID=1920299 RepID=UPI0026283D5E|nr:MAPEG family protein [Parasphingopyxis sp.]
MTLPVTAALAAAMAALLLLLAVDTVRNRFRTQQAFGMGEDEKLTRASRAHGNLAEHAPIVIIMVALLEMSRANHMGLMVVAGVFVVARVLHALGLYMDPPDKGGPPWPRAVGVILTWLVIAALGAWTALMLLGNLGN